MASRILTQINHFVGRIEYNLICLFRGGHPGMPALCEVSHYDAPNAAESAPDPFSIKSLIGDGLLWAVPKHRVSIERRMKKKYGHPKYGMKIFLPKTTLRQCDQCGHDHEVGVLCPKCYKKVIDETKQMQEQIKNALGLEPVDKEVVVLYTGEKSQSSEFWEGKRIIEMEKARPSWFHQNLLQKSTTPQAETKEVKPSDLG